MDDTKSKEYRNFLSYSQKKLVDAELGEMIRKDQKTGLFEYTDPDWNDATVAQLIGNKLGFIITEANLRHLRLEVYGHLRPQSPQGVGSKAFDEALSAIMTRLSVVESKIDAVVSDRSGASQLSVDNSRRIGELEATVINLMKTLQEDSRFPLDIRRKLRTKFKVRTPTGKVLEPDDEANV